MQMYGVVHPKKKKKKKKYGVKISFQGETSRGSRGNGWKTNLEHIW